MSEPAADTGSNRTTLIDIGNCIGCRACQVACKQWNEKDGEQTAAGVRSGLPESGGAQREDAHAHRVPRVRERTEARRHRIRVRDAAVPALPGAGLRLRLPDDGAPETG